jgi:ribosomal protein S18 acetylase RimI-like enzyme
VIRLADESHVDAAWSIIDRCRAALLTRGVLQWDLLYPTRDVVAADIAGRRLHVLLDQDRCTGVVTLDIRQDPEYASVPWTTGEPALIVHRLCVDPLAQGRGFGAQLMDHVEAHAKRGRFASIRLDAFSRNPSSLALYRRRGYREAGQVYFPRRAFPFVCFEREVTGQL